MIKKINKIAKEIRQNLFEEFKLDKNNNLCGFCGIASAKLFQKLKDVNIKTEICLSMMQDGDHCFLLFENFIVDITASQFSLDFQKKFIFSDTKNHPYWKIKKKFKTVNGFKKYQERTGWPEEQVC